MKQKISNMHGGKSCGCAKCATKTKKGRKMPKGIGYGKALERKVAKKVAKKAAKKKVAKKRMR